LTFWFKLTRSEGINRRIPNIEARHSKRSEESDIGALGQWLLHFVQDDEG